MMMMITDLLLGLLPSSDSGLVSGPNYCNDYDDDDGYRLMNLKSLMMIVMMMRIMMIMMTMMMMMMGYP